jgi:hypothetical protein
MLSALVAIVLSLAAFLGERRRAALRAPPPAARELLRPAAGGPGTH